MGGDTDMADAAETRVHCCECWRYTDDVRERTERHAGLLNAALNIVVNSNTLAVEKSASFAAADAFLARMLDANGPPAAALGRLPDLR